MIPKIFVASIQKSNCRNKLSVVQGPGFCLFPLDTSHRENYKYAHLCVAERALCGFKMT